MTLQAALDANNKELEGTKYDSELRQETEMLNNALQASVDIYGSQLTLKAALDSNQKILEAAKAESTDKLTGTKYVADKNLEGTKAKSADQLSGTRYTADKNLEGTKYTADQDLTASMFGSAQDAAADIHKTNIEAGTETYGIDKEFEKNMCGIAQETAVDIYEINKRAETNDWKNGAKSPNTNKSQRGSLGKKQIDWTKTRQFLEIGNVQFLIFNNASFSLSIPSDILSVVASPCRVLCTSLSILSFFRNNAPSLRLVTSTSPNDENIMRINL